MILRLYTLGVKDQCCIIKMSSKYLFIKPDIKKVHPALLLLSKIPRGKVVTYKELAWKCKTSPRAIGTVMAGNKHPEIYPCHRVVSSRGELTGYSLPGGLKEKRRKLEHEGVKFRADGRVEANCFFLFYRDVATTRFLQGL